MRKLSQRGEFPLVETLVVMAIIAFLVTIAIPQFTRFRMRSLVDRELARLTALVASNEVVPCENHPYRAEGLPGAYACVVDEIFETGGKTVTLNYYGSFKLEGDRLIPQGEVVYFKGRSTQIEPPPAP